MITQCNSENNRGIIVYSNMVTSGQTATRENSEDLPGQPKKNNAEMYLYWLYYFFPTVLAVTVPATALLCHIAKLQSWYQAMFSISQSFLAS